MTTASTCSAAVRRTWIARGVAGLALVTQAVVARASAAQVPADAKPATPATSATRSAWKDDRVLRVCADPDNLPFSNRRGEGFENRIAALVAEEMGDSLSYEWWPERRGFIRNTLRAGACDVTFGVPAGFDAVLSTRPYYRSTYHLAFPASRRLAIGSLDDPALRRLRIGVHLIGEDQTHPPPVHALLARGISRNVTGFSTFFGEGAHHPGEMFEALARGEIDVAIAWGPLAGYFAQRSPQPLTLVPLPDDARSGLPFAFDVGAGVRRSDRELRERLNEVLERRRSDVERILREFNVPVVDGAARTTGAPRPTAAAARPTATQDSVRRPPAARAASGRRDSAPPRPAAVQPRAAQPPAAQPPAAGATQRAAGQASLEVSQAEYNGWKTFAVNCTRCHGEDAIGSALAPSLLKSLQQAVTRDVFVQTVRDGRLEKGMPAWKDLLTPAQIDQLYAYVKARSDGRLAAGRPRVRAGR